MITLLIFCLYCLLCFHFLFYPTFCLPCSTFNWTVPFCSYLMCVIFTLGTVVLYLVPLKFLLLAWGKISSKTLLESFIHILISLWRICYKNQAYSVSDKVVLEDPKDLMFDQIVHFFSSARWQKLTYTVVLSYDIEGRKLCWIKTAASLCLSPSSPQV